MFLYSNKSIYNDLIQRSSINAIGKAFELIGIYKVFIGNKQDKQSFTEVYKKEQGRTIYHYRNIGECVIKEIILATRNQKVSRRSMRLLSQTWWKIPVITTPSMGIIFEETMHYIKSENTLWEIFTNNILYECHNASKVITNNLVFHCLYRILDFQYVFLGKFVSITKSESKRKQAREILKQWEENQIVPEIHNDCIAHRRKLTIN